MNCAQPSSHRHRSIAVNLFLICLVLSPTPIAMAGGSERPPQRTAVRGSGASPDRLLYESPPATPPASPSPVPPGEADRSGGIYLFSGEYFLAEEDLRLPGRGIDFVWARKYRSRIGPNTAQGDHWDYSYDVFVQAEGTGFRVNDGNTRSDLYSLQSDGTYAAKELFREGTLIGGKFTLVFADSGQWVFRALDGSPAQGRLERIVDRNGNALALQYDSLGRLNQITDTLDHVITVAYSADGHISSITDFAGRQVTYAYYGAGDADGSQGDLKSVTSPAVTGTPNGNDFPAGKTTTYTYSHGFADAALNHNLLGIVDARGRRALTNVYADTLDPGALAYDRVVQQWRGELGGVTDISYSDQSGVIQAVVTDGGGRVIQRSYDPANRLVVQRNLTALAPSHDMTTRNGIRAAQPSRMDDPPYFETSFEYNEDALVIHAVHENGNETQNVFELELDSGSAWRSRGNLREVHRYPGSHSPVGDQSALHLFFEYEPGTNALTRAIDANGGVTQHTYDGKGNRTHTEHPIATIVEDFEYNAAGQMTSRRFPADATGHRRRDNFRYYLLGSQKGRLKQWTVDAGGLAITTNYEYDQVGNATRIVDPRANTWLLMYNALNQIVREESPIVTGSVRYRRDFFYDANDNLVQIEVQNIDENGQVRSNASLVTSYDYDALDRVIRTTREVDETSRVTTEYAYDASGNLALLRSGEAILGNQPENVVQLTWDARNRLLRSARAPGSPLQSTTQYDWDGNGNLTRVSQGLEGEPRITTRVYDAFDRLLELTDPMGNGMEHHYDGNGNRVAAKAWGELVDGQGSGSTIRLWEAAATFDAVDRLTEQKVAFFDPATQQPIGDGQATTTWEYDDRSLVVRVVDDNGHQSLFAHDAAGRLVSATDARGNVVTYAYDPTSNVNQVSMLEKSDLGSPDASFVTTLTYDSLNRTVGETDTLGQAMAYAYDALDLLVRVTDRKGNRTLRTYDGLGRLLSMTQQPQSGAGQIAIGRTWDSNSRLIGESDGNGNQAIYGYDALDRLVSVTRADGTSTTLAHDVHDNVVATVDANGSAVSSTYDRLDRLTRRDIVVGSGVSSATSFEVYQYDGLSRLVRAENDGSVLGRSYDSLSHLVSEVENGARLVSTYDGVGNEIDWTLPGGRRLGCTYDVLNRRKTIAEDTQVIATYDYFGSSRVELRQYLRPTPTIWSDYVTDDLGRVIVTQHTPQEYPFLPVEMRSYQWDPMSNKTQCNDLRGGGPELASSYSYDFAHRLVATLVTEYGSGATVRDTTYVLDGSGNRTLVTGDECAGDYLLDTTVPEPADYQVNQYTATPCEPGGSRVYDRNGNLSRIVLSPTSSRQFAYDYRDQIVSHTGITGDVTTYAYDALGRCIQRSTGSGTTRLLYHQDHLVEEQDTLSNTLATYVWGARPDELLEMRRGGQDYAYLEDEQGSIMAVVDAVTSDVVERYEYGDFGQVTILDPVGNVRTGSVIGNAFLFEAQPFEQQMGLYRMRGGALDPRIGRFVDGEKHDPGDRVRDWGNACTALRNNPRTRGAMRGFNPQPDPPGRQLYARGFNPQPDPPGRDDIGGFDPETVVASHRFE
ncbi:MAG: DUF6531 domain-containing protein [Planctomycetota bacterium]